MPDEPWNCVTQSKLHPMASQPIGIARLFLSIPATSWEGAERLTSPPHPPSWPTEGGRGTRGKWMVTWRKGVSTQFYRDSYRRQMWTSRIVHETWQHWPYKPSRQETAVLVVHWCSVTRRLLWGSLIKIALPPAIRNSTWEAQQDQELQCGATVKETLWFGDSLDSPKFKLSETKRLSKWAFFPSLYQLNPVLHWVSEVLITSCVKSQTQLPSLLSPRAVCQEPDSATFFTESLSHVSRARLSHLLRWFPEPCVKSQTQPPSSLSPWAMWVWVRLSHYLLSLCVVH